MFQSRHLIALRYWVRPPSVVLRFIRRTQADGDIRQGLLIAWRRMRSNNLTPTVLALSIAVGLAVGLLPLYGLHGVLVAALCLPFRLDAVLAFAATMISNPFTFPLLTWLEVHIGCMVVGGVCPNVEALLRGEGVMDLGYQLMVGAAVSAALVGCAGALIVWVVAHGLQANKQAR